MTGHALIFDSGVGGLSVAAEIRLLLPRLQQTYIADDEFRPYGEKTDAQLRDRLPAILWTLCEAIKPDIVVIACNTASTSALSEIRAVLSIPVIGVVPAIKPAAQISPSGRFAVLGTPGTVRRKYVDQLISDFAPNHEVVLQGSSQLVALAEDKLAGRPVDPLEIKAESAPIFENGLVDRIVLACTHFPLLKDELSAAAPKRVKFIDSGEAIARRVETVLGQINRLEPARAGSDIALLIGPDAEPARKEAFHKFGFKRVVGLLPKL
jgi:glutamate racemase